MFVRYLRCTSIVRWFGDIFKAFSKVTLEKKLKRQKASSVWNNLICSSWKNQTIWYDIVSQSSSSRCFQGHNLHAFSCINFSLWWIFFIICIINNYPRKTVDQLAHSRAKDHRTSFLCPLIEKQYRALRMRASFRLITLFLCTVQDAQCNTEESP